MFKLWRPLAPVLSPLGYLWGQIMILRRKAYKRGLFPSYRPRAKVVSVGNLSLGGEGKTPLVAWLAEFLQKRGKRVVILLRGYKGSLKKTAIVSRGEGPLLGPDKVGDEVYLLALKTRVPVMISPDRVAGAFWAQRYFEAEIIVLDDGFQHLRLERDLDLVLFSAATRLKREKVFPAGRLREPLVCLKEADAFLITKVNLEIENLELFSKLKSFGKPIFRLPYFLDAPFSITSGGEGASERKLVAFCGLAQPENFFEALKKEGYHLEKTVAFPDHHLYRTKDIERLVRLSEELGAPLATTEKDAVKIKRFGDFGVPCYVFPLKPHPGKDFEEYLLRNLVF